MTIWFVSNGFRGYAWVTAIVEADNEADAIAQGRSILAIHKQADEPGWLDELQASSHDMPMLVEMSR